jgi:hypothetical protein
MTDEYCTGIVAFKSKDALADFKAGLMAEAAVGGQKFSCEPM